MIPAWVLVEWADGGNFFPKYGLVHIDSSVVARDKLRAGGLTFVRERDDKLRRAQVVMISDDKTKLRDYQMFIERQDDKVKHIITLCMKTIRSMCADAETGNERAEAFRKNFHNTLEARSLLGPSSPEPDGSNIIVNLPENLSSSGPHDEETQTSSTEDETTVTIDAAANIASYLRREIIMPQEDSPGPSTSRSQPRANSFPLNNLQMERQLAQELMSRMHRRSRRENVIWARGMQQHIREIYGKWCNIIFNGNVPDFMDIDTELENINSPELDSGITNITETQINPLLRILDNVADGMNDFRMQELAMHLLDFANDGENVEDLVNEAEEEELSSPEPPPRRRKLVNVGSRKLENRRTIDRSHIRRTNDRVQRWRVSDRNQSRRDCQNGIGSDHEQSIGSDEHDLNCEHTRILPDRYQRRIVSDLDRNREITPCHSNGRDSDRIQRRRTSNRDRNQIQFNRDQNRGGSIRNQIWRSSDDEQDMVESDRNKKMRITTRDQSGVRSDRDRNRRVYDYEQDWEEPRRYQNRRVSDRDRSRVSDRHQNRRGSDRRENRRGYEHERDREALDRYESYLGRRTYDRIQRRRVSLFERCSTEPVRDRVLVPNSHRIQNNIVSDSDQDKEDHNHDQNKRTPDHEQDRNLRDRLQNRTAFNRNQNMDESDHGQNRRAPNREVKQERDNFQNRTETDRNQRIEETDHDQNWPIPAQKQDKKEPNDDQNEKVCSELPIDPNEMVTLGNGNVSVPARLIREINWDSHTNATRQLLQAVFPRRVLATHSLSGKQSPAFANKPAKKQLDPKKVEDIVNTVADRCGVSKRLVRSSITIKCTDEAKLYRNRMQGRQQRPNSDENEENISPSISPLSGPSNTSSE